MTQEEKTEFEIRATHEAAHAVVAHVLGFRIENLDIKVNGAYSGTFGIVNADDDVPLDWDNARHRELVKKYDVVVAAGGCVGNASRGRTKYDTNLLSEHAARMLPTWELQESYKAEIRAQAQALVESHRDVIDTLALNFWPRNGVIDAGNAHSIIEAALATRTAQLGDTNG